jgi:DNA-binding PadR family transcriptional regulator
MSTRPLTTTSYAILGVLAMRPWSAYDLTAYMRTSAVRRCWPRTESRLYAEPKNLVHHGLVEASKQYTGKRSRTVYSITKAGTEALTRWLGERPERWETEDEYLLRMILSDHGTRDQLLVTIRYAMEEMLDRLEVVMDISGRVVAGRPRFPERLHLTAFNARYGIRLGRQRYDFLKWAAEWVSTWDDTQLEGKEEEASRVIAECRAELEQLDAEVRETLGRGPRDRDRSQRRRPGGGGRDEMKGGV